MLPAAEPTALPVGCSAGMAGASARARDVDPRVAIDEEVLWQAAKVSVIVRCLDVSKAGAAVAYEVAASRKLPSKIAEELTANRVGVPGAAGTVEKDLGETLCAILVRQPVENDARVLAVEAAR